MSEAYDDMLPVSLMENRGGCVLLDRHNDVLAVFDQSLEVAECQRIVDLINRGSTA